MLRQRRHRGGCFAPRLAANLAADAALGGGRPCSWRCGPGSFGWGARPGRGGAIRGLPGRLRGTGARLRSLPRWGRISRGPVRLTLRSSGMPRPADSRKGSQRRCPFVCCSLGPSTAATRCGRSKISSGCRPSGARPAIQPAFALSLASRPNLPDPCAQQSRLSSSIHPFAAAPCLPLLRDAAKCRRLPACPPRRPSPWPARHGLRGAAAAARCVAGAVCDGRRRRRHPAAACSSCRPLPSVSISTT